MALNAESLKTTHALLEDEATSESSESPVASRVPSNNDLNALSKPLKVKSLKDRSKIPFTFYLSVFVIASSQYVGRFYKLSTFKSWFDSIQISFKTSYDGLAYF